MLFKEARQLGQFGSQKEMVPCTLKRSEKRKLIYTLYAVQGRNKAFLTLIAQVAYLMLFILAGQLGQSGQQCRNTAYSLFLIKIHSTF